MFLEAHFGHVTQPSMDPENDEYLQMKVNVDGVDAVVDLISMKVDCDNDELKARIEKVVEMALTTMTPLSRLFAGQALEDVPAIEAK